MYERRIEALASRETFHRRVVTSGSVAGALVVVSLLIGIAGYAGLEHLDFVDAFLNAAMILSGMGPLHSPQTTTGKLFAGIYALYSGFAVIAITAIAIAPVVHRIFHRFHIEESEEARAARDGAKKRR